MPLLQMIFVLRMSRSDKFPQPHRRRTLVRLKVARVPNASKVIDTRSDINKFPTKSMCVRESIRGWSYIPVLAFAATIDLSLTENVHAAAELSLIEHSKNCRISTEMQEWTTHI